MAEEESEENGSQNETKAEEEVWWRPGCRLVRRTYPIMCMKDTSSYGEKAEWSVQAAAYILRGVGKISGSDDKALENKPKPH
jgi:hypothetical protein